MRLFPVVQWGSLHGIVSCSVNTETGTSARFCVLADVADVTFKNFEPNFLISLQNVFQIVLVRHFGHIHFVWQIYRLVEVLFFLSTRNYRHCQHLRLRVMVALPRPVQSQLLPNLTKLFKGGDVLRNAWRHMIK